MWRWSALHRDNRLAAQPCVILLALRTFVGDDDRRMVTAEACCDLKKVVILGITEKMVQQY